MYSLALIIFVVIEKKAFDSQKMPTERIVCLHFIHRRSPSFGRVVIGIRYVNYRKSLSGVIRIRNSKKSRQHNGQEKKDKRTNNDLQNIHIKLSSNTNPTKNRGWTQVLRKVECSDSSCGARRVILVTNLVISHEWGKDRKMLTTSETYSWSFATQIFH